MKPTAAPARSFTPPPFGTLQRKCACGESGSSGGECEGCKKKKQLQRSTAGSGLATAPPIVHEVLRSPGQPLDGGTRALFEPRFGHDFSRVRLHTNERAAESARAVNALAYTVGHDIVFANRPSGTASMEATRLMAHELSHVVQQSGAGSLGTGSLEVGAADSAQEREADRAAAFVASGQPSGSLHSLAGGAVQRDTAPAPSPTDCGSDGRPLTPAERSAAEFVFGSSLNLDVICIKESWIKSAGIHGGGEYYRTPGNTIYVGPGQKNSIPMHYVIHELTHSYQSQHGVWLATKAAYAIYAHYDYGGEKGLRDAIAAKKCFTDFNTEQQADIVADYYDRAASSQSTYPWSVFVDQVRAGGACNWPTTPAEAPPETPKRTSGVA